ncbi:MAG: thiamine-phosphate kinase [Azospirillaceae bacterium]|nr:thiamine-phosphate kinase [Azospirillaceae bacterium]
MSKTDAPLGEFGRIRQLFRPLAAGFAGALNLSDDAALINCPAGFELVVTTDAMVAGVHFFVDDTPEDVAAKLLRVNLSDLAAMGAQPLAYTLITSVPTTIDDAWMTRFAASLALEQAEFGIMLAGGDSVATPGPASFAVTAFGFVPIGQAVRRSGGQVGDRVFVTGTIGDAALALKIAFGQIAMRAGSDALLARLRRPTPRLGLGAGVRGLVSAMADVSDGLVADLGHIAEASGVCAVVACDRVPLSGAARAVLDESPELLATVLTGGDDYELVFTAPAHQAVALQELAAAAAVAITDIGHLTAPPEGRQGGAVTVLDPQGQPLPLTSRGWEHF